MAAISSAALAAPAVWIAPHPIKYERSTQVNGGVLPLAVNTHTNNEGHWQNHEPATYIPREDASSLASQAGEATKTAETTQTENLTEAGIDKTFMVNLLTIRAYLRVAKELAEQRRWDDAIRYFSREDRLSDLYEAIEGRLVKRDLEQFAADIDAFGALLKTKSSGGQFESDYASVDSKIEAAMASIANRTSLDLVLPVMLALLKQAAQEYQSAVSDSKISGVINYQDGWGLVEIVEQLLNGVAAKLNAKDALAYQRLNEELAKLHKAWPGVVPPAVAAITPDEVNNSVAQVEQVMQNFKR